MKPDPIEVEKTFRGLIYQLETTESVRHRYILLLEFLEYLDWEYEKYESYIQQIVDVIPVFMSPVIWSGVNPAEVEENLLFLEEVSAELRSLKNDINFADIVRRFKEVNILLYCCLNDCNKAITYIRQLFDIRHTDEINAAADTLDKDNTLYSLKHLIENIIEKKHSLSDEEKLTAKRLLKQIQNILSDDGHSGSENNSLDKAEIEAEALDTDQRKRNAHTALIPVAEIHRQENKDVEYGRLRFLTIEIYGTIEKKDQLIQNFRRYGAEQMDNHDQNSNALKAARNLFISNGHSSKNTFYKGGVFFELTGAIHHGSSADLAISALWYTMLTQITQQRNQYKLNSRAVLTGVVDKKGHILPVNQGSITSKTEAAFFSWANTLVVPESQKDLFEEALSDLEARFPTKQIELIAINHLKDLLNERRVTSHHTLNWWEYMWGRFFGAEV